MSTRRRSGTSSSLAQFHSPTARGGTPPVTKVPIELRLRPAKKEFCICGGGEVCKVRHSEHVKNDFLTPIRVKIHVSMV